MLTGFVHRLEYHNHGVLPPLIAQRLIYSHSNTKHFYLYLSGLVLVLLFVVFGQFLASEVHRSIKYGGGVVILKNIQSNIYTDLKSRYQDR